MSAPILEVRDISKALGSRPVLNGVSFQVNRGEACAVIGPSGGGKTTLLKCINLLLTIDHGEIFLDSSSVVRATEGARIDVRMQPAIVRQRIGMVFQEWNLWPNMTIRDNVCFALYHVRKLSRGAAHEIAEQVLSRVGLRDKLDVYPFSLSGGQKQRAAIARALAMNPEILMLDEVTSALDPILAAEVLEVMTQLKQDGRTLVVVTHHIEFAREVADKVIFLSDGKVTEEGLSGILEDPQTQDLARFLRKVRRAH
jgi:polar amino acid transport system ATP-binding protein